LQYLLFKVLIMKNFIIRYIVFMTMVVLPLKHYATNVKASQFGFNTTDATDALRAAVAANVDSLIIDNQGSPWVTGQLFFQNKINYTIIIEPGVVIKARSGYGFYDCVFNFNQTNTNIVMIGYGATIQMLRGTYTDGSQFRHCILLSGTNGFQVYGVKLIDSGGDGISIAPNYFDNITPAKNVIIQDCYMDNHDRQGISVNSVENLVIENCLITGTNGQDPAAGIDLEPYRRGQVLKNVNIRNCRILNNLGYGIMIELGEMETFNNSIKIDGVYIENCDRGGITVRDGFYGRESGPGIKDEFLCNGTVDVSNTWIRNIKGPAVICVKPADSLITTFTNCVFENTNTNTTNQPHFGVIQQTALFGNGVRVGPILVSSYVFANPDIPLNLIQGIQFGGVAFNDCVIVDNVARSYLTSYGEAIGGDGLTYNQPMKNVTGNIRLINTAPSSSTDLYNNIPSFFQNVTIQKNQIANYPATTLNVNTFDNQAIEGESDFGFFNFQRSSTDNSYPLPVAYSVSGTATTFSDYVYVPDFKMIPANASSATQVIIAIKDALAEPIETVNANLSGIPTFYSLGSNVTSTVNITPPNTSLGLPSQLIYFKGTPITGGINIEWAVSNEHDAAQYEIERGLEMNNFQPVKKVASNGGLSVESRYNIIDNTVLPNTQYLYRLKQIDKDGDIHYLKTITVGKSSTQGIIVYPNPTRDNQINIMGKGITASTKMTLFNSEGKMVSFTNKQTGLDSWRIQANSVLSAGVYYLQIKNGDQLSLLPIMVR
jgi:hypothetical protein